MNSSICLSLSVSLINFLWKSKTNSVSLLVITFKTCSWLSNLLMNIAVLCSNSADTHIWGDLSAHTACSCQHNYFFPCCFCHLRLSPPLWKLTDEQETHQVKAGSHKKLFTMLQSPGKQFLMALFKKWNCCWCLIKTSPAWRPDVKSHSYYLSTREVWSKFDILAWANTNSRVVLHAEHTVNEALF